MSDDTLRALADEAGLATRWRDAFGAEHDVTPDALRAVLHALGTPAGTDSEIADSRRAVAERNATCSPLLVTGPHEAATIHAGTRFRVVFEDGGAIDGATGEDGRLPPIDRPGYHSLETDAGETTLAVAPAAALALDALGAVRSWGLAAQLYSLRRDGDAADGGIGDFAALADLARAAGRAGAAALAISPVHAQFTADPDRFSPYAPSSRVMLNAAHIPCDLPAEPSDLVDWPAAQRARAAWLRDRYTLGRDDPAFAAWRRNAGDLLERHARFEALHGHFFGRDLSLWHWRSWPAEFRDPNGPAVAAFADTHRDDVAYHAWLQFLANRALADAQAAARERMPIGLVSDLAVGTDSGGSHAWSRQDEMLSGVTIGAPPDLLSPRGQDWGLVAFSPAGLRRNGYGAFIEMLRAALRHAGGVRIDHVMGLGRLWVKPDGAPPADGTYLAYPLRDLLRLVALESHRHRAIVLGEDLGTVPHGFQDTLRDAGVLGLRVLWFERAGDDGFKPPRDWSPNAVAMTSTHDLPTLAGWWSGADLDARAALGLVGDEATERAGRAADRDRLWRAMRDSGHASGDAPAPWDAWPFVDAATGHVASTACGLMLLPLEDLIGRPEQPNLPGTLHEHPNWRRRMPDGPAALFSRPDVAARLGRLRAARR